MALSDLDKAAIQAYKKLQDISYFGIFKAGVEYNEERYNKLEAIAEKMYTAAQYFSDNPDNPDSAESLRKAMQEYYNFINNIK